MKLRTLLLGALTGLLLSVMSTSCTTVETGETGFMKTYSDGVDTNDNVYGDGTIWHSPWNDVMTMNTQQQSLKYDNVPLKDANQVILVVDYAIAITLRSNKAPHMYKVHGNDYQKGYVNDVVSAAVKDVFGRFGYVDILGNKRNHVEDEITNLVKTQFAVDNYLTLNYVQVKDVQLPKNIQLAINGKEEQEQINEKAKKKKVQETYLADARLEKARGDSSLVISANYKAEAIKITSKELAKSPAYVEYVKWNGYAAGKGSPYGSNNVFGSGTGILKQIK